MQTVNISGKRYKATKTAQRNLTRAIEQADEQGHTDQELREHFSRMIPGMIRCGELRPIK